MATNFKCHFCKICNGKACKSELPGMGGVRENENFILNISDWEKIRKRNENLIKNFLEKKAEDRIPRIAFAPVTGAVENIGFKDEQSYYTEIFKALSNVGIDLCIGDGFPDEKLKFGIEAIKNINSKASVFIKPYTNEKIIQRISWAKDIANVIGIDIDSYNILTMRNLVNLEKKNTENLLEIKNYIQENLKIPFAVKGVFTEEDIELVKKVKPNIIYISNHGGRVETQKGSTADFLEKNVNELKNYCEEIWVDGGIRSPLDIATAFALGADKVLIGRPFISAFCKGAEHGLCEKAMELNLVKYAH